VNTQTISGALLYRTESGAADIAELGLRFRQDTSFESWRSTGQRLAEWSKVLPWKAGDWAFWGESRFGNAVVEETALELGFDLDELRELALVAGRFTLGRRRSKLSIQHHAQLALFGSDDEQERLLDLAEQEGWSSRQLKNALREAALSEGAVGEDAESGAAPPAWSEPEQAPSENDVLLSVLESMRHIMTLDDVREIMPRAKLEGISSAQWLRRYLDELRGGSDHEDAISGALAAPEKA
jgi:hypothetical protein